MDVKRAADAASSVAMEQLSLGTSTSTESGASSKGTRQSKQVAGRVSLEGLVRAAAHGDVDTVVVGVLQEASHKLDLNLPGSGGLTAVQAAFKSLLTVEAMVRDLRQSLERDKARRRAEKKAQVLHRLRPKAASRADSSRSAGPGVASATPGTDALPLEYASNPAGDARATRQAVPGCNNLLQAATPKLEQNHRVRRRAEKEAMRRNDKLLETLEIEVAILLGRGADLTLPEQSAKSMRIEASGWTMLHYACDLGLRLRAEQLVYLGLAVDAQAADGRTPLMVAAHRGSALLVACMLRAGADLDRRDGRGWTALHHAASRGNLTCCRCLLLAGAGHRTVNKAGQTPSDVALRKGQVRAAQLISMHSPAKIEPARVLRELEHVYFTVASEDDDAGDAIGAR